MLVALWRRGQSSHHQKLVNNGYTCVIDVDGAPGRYVLYTIEEPEGTGGDKILQIVDSYGFGEIRFDDVDAFSGLLYYLTSSHTVQIDQIMVDCPTTVEIFDLVDDPQFVDCEHITGSMFRLVDVIQALDPLDYPESVTDELTISIDNPIAEWNDGTFVLNGPNGNVERVSAENAVDFRIPIDVFSQIYAGYLSPSEAAELNTMSVKDVDKLPAFDQLFPDWNVCLSEYGGLDNRYAHDR